MQHVELERSEWKCKASPAGNGFTRDVLCAVMSKTLILDLETFFPPLPQLRKFYLKKERIVFGPCNSSCIKYQACSGNV